MARMVLVEDRRRAEIVEYHLVREGERLPTVPPYVRNCVGFVYDDQHGRRAPTGTVFFVEIWEEDTPWSYAVTSRHVVTDSAKEGNERIYVRLNRRGGGLALIGVDIADWTLHSSTEVATVHFPLQQDIDCDPYLISAREVIPFGEGAEVFIAGLFEQRPGKTRNIPVIRTGSIAAMPSEPILTDHGTFPAFLIEARSIPGMSGSPVFRCHPVLTDTNSPLSSLLGGGGFMLGGMDWMKPHQSATDMEYVWSLLGVAYGHYQTKYRARSTSQRVHRLNTGIALVVPTSALVEMLNSDQEKDMRKKQKDKDAASSSKDIAADRRGVSSHKEFEQVLRRVSARIDPTPGSSPPGRGTKGT